MFEKDLPLFEEICKLSQEQLHKIMANFLQKHYKNVIITEDYIIAKGDIPIGLVAHLDTVFLSPPVNIFFDREKQVLWSPEGLGADDRAGIYLITRFVRDGLRPHIILTTDEESGCFGADALTKAYPHHPFKSLKYLIQLDRRGADDCVFYDCNNPKFEVYVEKFGFKTNFGSFSDISAICPEWGIAGVNLSVGYINEHSKEEILCARLMMTTYERVSNMLKEKDIPYFKYIPTYNPYGFSWSSTINDVKSKYQVKCRHCGDVVFDFDAIATKSREGGTVFYCLECGADPTLINWCECCGEAFELESPNLEEYLCKDCREKINNV